MGPWFFGISRYTWIQVSGFCLAFQPKSDRFCIEWHNWVQKGLMKFRLKIAKNRSYLKSKSHFIESVVVFKVISFQMKSQIENYWIFILDLYMSLKSEREKEHGNSKKKSTLNTLWSFQSNFGFSNVSKI